MSENEKKALWKAFKEHLRELKKKNRNLDFIWEEQFIAGWMAKAEYDKKANASHRGKF